MTLRVLHVITTINRRGGELFASDLVRALDSDGIDQKVAVLHPPNGMSRVSFEAPTLVVRGASKTPVLGRSVEAMRALRHLISDWGPHVVQAHGGEPFKYLVVSGAGGQSKLVYRRIGAAPQWILRGPRRVAHGILMRRAAEVVTVAEALRKETLDVFGVPPSRVRVIPNGVDPARLKPGRSREATRDSLGIARDAHIIVSLGALTWEKDPLAHLAISAQVLRQIPNVVHLFVGDGPMRFRAQRAAEALGVQETTRFLGSREDVPDLLNASDVMLLASAAEGMPGGVIEAGMMELPVVAYALAGIPEAVIDGGTGRLASPGDQRALTNHLLDMLADPAGRRRLGKNARHRCMSLFDMRVIAPQYLAVYEDLASRGSTSHSSSWGVS